ncbi:hypothetical protein SUS17_1852 [Sphingomonas sp. S17]|uniref:Uncharacterized protein n=2 Tax=Sphingomonas paucimobilis TaxID=13689 RepID=A0A7T3A7Q7_SPHPI|nr:MULTISPECIES: hypothetical protein [Sphingomonas]EGI55294.1 hypothetical protein SUS17_1852 [Sphingomonas sp. S17]MCM3680929.1 hypothetical protein [Sphingomonas paucimobilis]MDG5971359.1 hypothetical protein [Sphingomonas paucimobilis]QPS15933.1 hypothetical protein I6G65_16780 [Sphingomonas paucimobilis]QPT07387.1 hypothetical protein I6G38_10985 [Sphingomonas paucimobilis]
MTGGHAFLSTLGEILDEARNGGLPILVNDEDRERETILLTNSRHPLIGLEGYGLRVAIERAI